MLAAIVLTGLGGDAFFLALTAAFFGLCLLLVNACEHIMGPDPVEAREGGEPVAVPEQARVEVSA